MRWSFKHRKGVFFTFDALVAISLLLIAFSYLAAIPTAKTFQKSEYQQMHYLADDAIQAFSNTKFSSINETIRDEIMALPRLSGEDIMNKSVIEAIGLIWSVYNETEYERNYSANITRDFFGPLLAGMNYSLKIGDYKSTTPVQIYSSTGTLPSQETRKQQTSTFRIISGYKEKSPHTGFVARAYVTGAAKKTQSYIYFGGFEGNGNITKLLELPSIINTIQGAYLEMDTESNFTIFVNGIYSGKYNVSSSVPLRAKNWTMPSIYLSEFMPGQNNITVAFDDINKAYVGGGFIRVNYNTAQMDTAELKINPDGNVTEKYIFPGINGLINVYSSFYVPGILKSLGIQLHYLSEYNVFLNIGNVSVYSNGSNVSKYIYLNNTYLNSLLNYSLFNQTMPIRLGTNAVSGMNDGSDAILITDVSGSMGWWMANDNTNGVNRNCSDPLFSAPDTSRISVAKCADEEFINNILGTPGQKIGLVNYSTMTRGVVNLTDNSTLLIAKINSYIDDSSTCMSCGIINATNILAATINITTKIANKSAWLYNDSFLLSAPPIDADGRNWTHINYSLESSWKSGNAVFGNGKHNIQKTTEILGGITALYPDLWDMAADKSTPEIDFTTGMNYTFNTFGLGAGNDGWDWGADYGNDSALARNTYNVINGRLVYSTTLAGTNQCNAFDCSGGYGIQINITNEQYAFISSGGVANISFQYWWAPTQTTFESTDEVWIKGSWTEPGPVAHYFGTEQSGANGDSTPEIARGNNPDNTITGTYNQDITSWIAGPGAYYLDFGGKLMANANNERGNFSFDNILLEINNYSNTNNSVYFRKNFTISDINAFGKGLIHTLSGDSAEVYLNGALIFNNTGSEGVSWYATIINRKNFKQDDNIIAVKLYTLAKHPSRFDLMLFAINESRNKAMLVMSDGVITADITPYTTALTSAQIIANGSFSTSETHAINRSCYAYENYGIISHAVAFSSAADNATLKAIADCGHGNFYSSSNADELMQIYKDIANNIISYSTQTAEISGDAPAAKLYTDSFIEYNYTPYINNTYGNISLTFESETFGNSTGNYSVESPKNGSYNITSKMAVIDVKATSYSSNYWTSTLETNSTSGQWKAAFNLSKFGNAYLSLGDPFIVYVPASDVKAGEMNYVRINTASNATSPRGGSPDNKIIYTIKIDGSVGYGNTFATLENATEDAIKRLNDRLLELGITVTNVNTGSQNVGKIPWMWGPAIMTLEVWK
ncbi:MAG: hypothetical protein ABIF85_04035 [Nanoarchaeota archaeon]|nr:hypothetical protein [Nanoarchaeota archaeon]MBU4452276.1 hypothetical protein [Nanoarchaeota archaeon]MCG2724046.1 hypothetical protein [archaeon]